MSCPICGWEEKTSDPEARESALRRSRVSFAEHGHALRDWPHHVLWALETHQQKLTRDPALLTRSQREAVLAFLRYLATYGLEEADAARIERRWREAAVPTAAESRNTGAQDSHEP